jgi:hypothetical protein
MPVLRVREGASKGKELPLDLERGQLYCGSAPTTTFPIEEPGAAERHFRLVKDGERLTVTPLDSTELRVNDEVVDDATDIRIGDTLRIGATVLAIDPAQGEAVPESAKTQEPEAPAGPTPGMLIEGCQLIEELGSGSVGTVFRATQVSMERTVVVKFLHPHLAADKEFRQDFLMRARSTGQDRHPNVVQVYNAGEEGDLVYVVSEYMSGGSLGEIFEEEGALDWDALLPVLLDVCEALRYATGKALVHGGIHPENILLTDNGEVKVSDLGVAALSIDLPEVHGDARRVQYFAPERLEKKAGDIRSDIYSLGVVFFEALAARPPFQGSDPEVVRQEHLEESPPPIDSFTAHLPRRAAEILEQMLAKRPEERYASPDELIQALDQLDTEPEPGGPPKAKASAAPAAAPAKRRAAKPKAAPAAKPAPLRQGQPPVSAGERIRRHRDRVSPQDRATGATAGIIGLVVAIILAGIYLFSSTHEAGKETLRKAKMHMQEREYRRALAIVRTGQRGWDSEVSKELSDLELKLEQLVQDHELYVEARDLWNETVDMERDGADRETLRKRYLKAREMVNGSDYPPAQQLYRMADRKVKKLRGGGSENPSREHDIYGGGSY